jgi:hypothetical protein
LDNYAGGSGNDVTLVCVGTASGPKLTAGGGSYTKGAFTPHRLGNPSSAFTIQATTNLIQWSNIGTATGSVSGNFNFIDTNAAKFRYRFYRTTN